jgi:hypothetical protein
LKEEAEKKNKELMEEDKAKNLQWIVAGTKGGEEFDQDGPERKENGEE